MVELHVTVIMAVESVSRRSSDSSADALVAQKDYVFATECGRHPNPLRISTSMLTISIPSCWCTQSISGLRVGLSTGRCIGVVAFIPASKKITVNQNVTTRPRVSNSGCIYKGGSARTAPQHASSNVGMCRAAHSPQTRFRGTRWFKHAPAWNCQFGPASDVC